MVDKLTQASLEEVKNGYAYNSIKGMYLCLICGKEFETGEVFSFDDRFYDASKAIQFHIKKDHGDLFEILTSFNKKYTGITENQKELLSMIYIGLSDNEIAKKTGVASATVRHQRFAFREKAKQAKLYLAIYEVVEKAHSERKSNKLDDEYISIHDSATMVDDRYTISITEEDKIIKSVFESLQPLKLKVFSSKEKKKIVILRKIVTQFEKGRKYSEKEVNAILKSIFEDYASIRRYLVEYGFMDRTNNCEEYWLK